MNHTVEEMNELLAKLTAENEMLKKQVITSSHSSSRNLTDEERAKFKKHNSRYRKTESSDEANQMLAMISKVVSAIDEQVKLTKKLKKQKV